MIRGAEDIRDIYRATPGTSGISYNCMLWLLTSVQREGKQCRDRNSLTN